MKKLKVALVQYDVITPDTEQYTIVAMDLGKYRKTKAYKKLV